MHKLRLYIIGRRKKDVEAINELKMLLEGILNGEYSLEVIDLLKTPHLAIDHKIFATPTIVKELPEPVKKIIGNFTDKEKMLVGLDLMKSDESSLPDKS